MRGLWWQHIGNVRTLKILVVQRRGIQHWIFAIAIRSIDVDGEASAVSHRYCDVAFLNHVSLHWFACLPSTDSGVVA